MESLPNSFFVNNLPDLSKKANVNPTITLLRKAFCPSHFSPLLILLFGFCSFIRRGGRRGSIFALDFFSLLGSQKNVPNMQRCKETLASLVTSGLALSGGFSHGPAPFHTRAKSLLGN